MTSSDSGKTESVTAIVFREGDGQQNSIGLYVSESFYRNSNTYTLAIPTVAQERTLTITIPVSEMSNDNRYAIFTATAGTITQTQTISTYDPALGKSLRLVTLILENVPGSVNSVEIEVESPSSNGDSFAVGGAMELTVEPTNSTFPVEWTYFEVEPVGDAALLNWGTAIEINSDNFMVERSVNGALFEQISLVKAAGTTDQAQSYQFQDNAVKGFQAPIIYYRLRQIDMDGSFTYSKVVEYKTSFQEIFTLNAYPNPATDVLNIAYQSSRTTEFHLQIINLAGQVMEQQIFPSGEEEIQISVHSWPKGNYVIRLFNEERE